MQEEKNYLYRASYVVPVSAPPIEDGGILTEDGMVKAVGPFNELRRESAAAVVDYRGYAITPPLINCHAHLELSHLDQLGKEETPYNGDIFGWISRLLRKREEPWEEYEINDSALFALASLYTGGCGAVIDIGNREASRHIGADFKTRVFFFLEFLGLCGFAEQQALDRLAMTSRDLACSGHAPYSTGPELLQALKRRADEQGKLFPLHVAESADENEFLLTGRGRVREFLLERGIDTTAFPHPGIRAIPYLEQLGILDEKTLCVHGVEVTEAEIEILAAGKATVCLCPGSNRFLGVGVAPLEKYLDHGVNLVLGTDSLASNPTMNLWNEMKIAREDHPGIKPEKIFRLATLAGAQLLGLDRNIGSIEPGVDSSLLAIELDKTSPDDIFDFLTATGEDVSLEWIE